MLSTQSLPSAYASDRVRCSHPGGQDPSTERASLGGQHPDMAVSPPVLSPSDFVKRKLHERLMAGRAKTLSPAEAPRRVMTPEVGSARPETDVELTHAQRHDCGLLTCSGSEEEPRGSCQGPFLGRAVEMDDETRAIAYQECRGHDQAGDSMTQTGQSRATEEAGAGAPAADEAGCRECKGRGRWSPWGPGGCALQATNVFFPVDNHLPIGESVPRSDVVLSQENTHHMSIPISTGSGMTALKRPNPFVFASSDAVGRCSPKRIVFPFDTTCCDHLAAFPGNFRLNSAVVEDAVHRLRITEQTVRPRKKKSRRTPKVKKIKFHEYTGPNRRIPMQKPKSANTGAPANQPMARNANAAVKLVSSEISATQQHSERQLQNGTSPPTTLNLSTSLHQPPERCAIPPPTDPLRIPNLFQQISPTQSVYIPCTTTANASVGLAITPLQSPKTKESVCNVKLPPNTPPVAKAGTSAPLLVPVTVRRKDPSVACGGATNPNGAERKTLRRDAVIVEGVMSLDDLKVTELKEECKKRKLSVTGPKPRLLSRLLPFADEILNERNLPPSSSQSKAASSSLPKLNGDSKQDTTNAHVLAARSPDLPSQQNVQTPTIPSDHLKANSVVERCQGSVEAEVAAHRSPATTISNTLCSPNNPATCRPQLTDVVSTLIGYSRQQKYWNTGTLSGYDFPHGEKKIFENDALLAFCKELSEASKLKGSGALSDGLERVNVSPFHETSRAESLCGKVLQQQFLTPPATPTLQISGCVTCSPETPLRGTEVELVNLGPIALRALGCKPSPKSVMTPLTGAELWMLQEKQIAELHLQLQKSKAELSHARMKVCLQQQLSNDSLTSGIAVGKATHVLDSLVSLAQSQVSSTPEPGEIPKAFDAVGKTLEAKPSKNETVSAAEVGSALPSCDRRGSQSGTTGSAADQAGVVPEDVDDSGKFLLEEIPSQPETEGRAVEKLPLQSLKEYSEVLSSQDESSDTELGSSYLMSRSYFNTPAKEPPEYHEAMRQKLMLMQRTAASSAGESAESDSSEDLLVRPPSAAFSCSSSGPVKREEIEDVIEVLFGTEDLASVDGHSSLPVSDRMWLDDVRAVIRDLVLSTPSYFKPFGFDPDSPPNHVTPSHPEARWPTGNTETAGRHIASGGQVTENSCIGAPLGFAGLGVMPWGVCNEGVPCSSDEFSELPYAGFEWNDPSELGQPQFNWGSCPASDEETAGGGDPVTLTTIPPVSSISDPRSFCPTSAPPILSMATPTGRGGETTDTEYVIPPTLCRQEGGTPVSASDADMDSSSDLLTPAGTAQDLRWEGEWMDVFDGRRLTESAMNLFPAFAFSP